MNKRTSKDDLAQHPERMLLLEASPLTGAPAPDRGLLRRAGCSPALGTYAITLPTLPHLVSSVLSGLKLPHQPLELPSGICGVDQEPEVLTGTKIHIERDEAEAGAWGKGIEPPGSEIKGNTRQSAPIHHPGPACPDLCETFERNLEAYRTSCLPSRS